MKLNSFRIEETAENGQFLLQVNDGNHYLIGETIKKIFEIINVETYSRDHLINEVENKQLVTIPRTELENLIDDQIIPMLTEKASKKSIKKIFTVFKPKNVEFLMKMLQFLFKEKLFFSLLTIIILINTLYFFSTDIISSQATLNLFLPITLGVMISVIVHELGHATAAYTYDIMPKEVGFCLYFIFPAFYTDMNALWKLENKKRVIANLGGIYFQLLVNIILIAILFSGIQHLILKDILHSIIITNIAMCIYNLNPFFKFDGYWIYSDLVGIINLSEKSNTFIKKLITFRKQDSKTPLTLSTYAVLKIFFMIYIYTKMILWGSANISLAIIELNTTEASIDIKILGLAIVSIMILLILILSIINFIKKLIL